MGINEANRETNVAVFVDCDNIIASVKQAYIADFDIEIILDRLKEKGRVIVKKAYADWQRHIEYRRDMQDAGIELIELPSRGRSDKNATDIKLAVDAMGILFERDYIDTFVIVSGDSDFSGLVSKLKEFGKKVIGVGVRLATSGLLVELCDEFIFYEELPGVQIMKKPSAKPTKLDVTEAYELLEEAASALNSEGAGAMSSRVKDLMLRKKSSFSERRYGFPDFSAFLEAAEKRGLVQLLMHPTGGYLVNIKRPDQTSTERSEMPDATRYQSQLNRLSLRPLSAEIRGKIVADIVECLNNWNSDNGEATTRNLIQHLADNYRQQELEISKNMIQDVVRALMQTGCVLGASGQPPMSYGEPIKINLAADKLLAECNKLFIWYLAQSFAAPFNLNALSEILFGFKNQTDKVQKLIEQLVQEKRLSVKKNGSSGQQIYTALGDRFSE
ncbi:TPA: NYN domain-containing protein [Candidatus Poribacteria bacterium]|nr:NYN domain-containing protein [Candidatus Poribacteria bacterium]